MVEKVALKSNDGFIPKTALDLGCASRTAIDQRSTAVYYDLHSLLDCAAWDGHSQISAEYKSNPNHKF